MAGIEEVNLAGCSVLQPRLAISVLSSLLNWYLGRHMPPWTTFAATTIHSASNGSNSFDICSGKDLINLIIKHIVLLAGGGRGGVTEKLNDKFPVSI